jgi:hypothetical protein
LLAGPKWAPDTKTDRLIVGRNVTLTLAWCNVVLCASVLVKCFVLVI